MADEWLIAILVYALLYNELFAREQDVVLFFRGVPNMTARTYPGIAVPELTRQPDQRHFCGSGRELERCNAYCISIRDIHQSGSRYLVGCCFKEQLSEFQKVAFSCIYHPAFLSPEGIRLLLRMGTGSLVFYHS
ncbi:hypothetical protein ARMGADRAFT_298535 [Armillaria gallica]|uniref:Uncharacterized protein n=1 Tax=Armillaria gallica TaxID=47427 RepID=A0A2H3D9H2_ARMGA|nr:hypothetical protein ARMGADRAFT_298535 [Armillaria gallica]